MSRQEKIELVAGTSSHSVKFITEMVEGNDARLDRMVMIAKAQIGENLDEAVATMA